MRKFLMVAAVVAVAACGKKQGDTGSMEATGAAAGATVDTLAHKADSTMGAMADSAHSAMTCGRQRQGGHVRQRQQEDGEEPGDPAEELAGREGQGHDGRGQPAGCHDLTRLHLAADEREGDMPGGQREDTPHAAHFFFRQHDPASVSGSVLSQVRPRRSRLVWPRKWSRATVSWPV